MYNYKYFVSFAALAFASTASCLSVTPSNDPNALAKALLGDGITLVSATYTGSIASSGLYTHGPLGIRDSIVLTTGDAVDVIPGPGTAGEVSKSKGTPGNPMCNSLDGGITTYDGAVLSMNVILGPKYVGFSSEFIYTTEEYPEWTGSKFIDPFGIYIDGHQIAFNPNGNPINSDGAYFSSSALTPPASGSSMDGSTPRLWSGYDAAPGAHKIDIVICDTGDGLMDSAVFVAIDACHGHCKSTVPPSDDCSGTIDPPVHGGTTPSSPGHVGTTSSSPGHVYPTSIGSHNSTITATPVSPTEAPCVTYTSYIIKTITKCDAASCRPTTTVVPTVVTSTLQLTVYTPSSTLTLSRCTGGPGSPCVTYTNTVTYHAITTYPPVPTFTAPAGYIVTPVGHSTAPVGRPTFTVPVSAGAIPTYTSPSSVPFGNGTHGCAGGGLCSRPTPSAGFSIPSSNTTSNGTCSGGYNCPHSSIMLSFTPSAATPTKSQLPSDLTYSSAASHLAGKTSAVILGFIVAALVAAGI